MKEVSNKRLPEERVQAFASMTPVNKLDDMVKNMATELLSTRQHVENYAEAMHIKDKRIEELELLYNHSLTSLDTMGGHIEQLEAKLAEANRDAERLYECIGDDRPTNALNQACQLHIERVGAE